MTTYQLQKSAIEIMNADPRRDYDLCPVFGSTRSFARGACRVILGPVPLSRIVTPNEQPKIRSKS